MASAHFKGCDGALLWQTGAVSSTGLWPRGGMRPARSDAEAKVYAALARGLPSGWTAWHSVRIRTRAGFLGEGTSSSPTRSAGSSSSR